MTRPAANSTATPKSLSCLSGLRILDIGCGAGLLCEPFTRLGAQVIGIDPSATNIAAAKLHADKGHLSIDYRCTTVEEMDVRERFDIVLAMEVVEHVTDVGVFLDRCAALLKPGGLMVVSTLNRNWKSFALAIVGAEYVLRWLPRGTHQWDKFVTPDEFAHHLAQQQAHHHRTGRRGLQSDRRQMEHLVRYGRELHGGRGGGVAVIVLNATGVVPANAGTHTPRQLLATRRLPSALTRISGMGPCVRRDDDEFA